MTEHARLLTLPVALPTALLASLALAACTAMGPVRTTTVDQVDPERYLGTWYEVGSVKQFFSVGLVNVTANYQLNPDGTMRVENRGEYFTDGGPESTHRRQRQRPSTTRSRS